MSQPEPPAKNRRLNRAGRRSGPRKCLAARGAWAWGPNVVVAVLDLSEEGARLLLEVPRLPRQEVEVEPHGQNQSRPRAPRRRASPSGGSSAWPTHET